MHYGLDIGPGAIRAATDAGDGPTIDSIPPVVVPVDEGDLEAPDLRGQQHRPGGRNDARGRRRRSSGRRRRCRREHGTGSLFAAAASRDGDCGGRADRAERAPRRRDGRCHGRAPLLHDAGFARRRGGTDRRTPRGRRVSAGRSRGRRDPDQQRASPSSTISSRRTTTPGSESVSSPRRRARRWRTTACRRWP